ncbi:MAG: ATP-dependent Clp protease ATP-binding subunit, partial [Bacteroidota bacterium]|nr:ATP-dependent Clp protease ATP-binding subunit [Bacteroidota bacterium]
LDKLFNRINTLGYEVKLTEKAKSYIADKGFDEKYGARPLSRAIQKYIEDPLAEEIIQKNINEGDLIKIDFIAKTEDIKVSVTSPKKTKPKN